jgi:tripartite-type tricarboxylate transporter receptor subunit TctC
VPAKTPQAVIERLNTAANDALKQPAVQEKPGVRPQGGTPQQLTELLASKIKRGSAVIADAKLERQ